MKIIILALISFVFLFSKQMYKNSNFVVDKKHNLMWQDHRENTKILISHIKASTYCDELKLGGFANWRIPSINEYKYIIDKSRGNKPMINKAFRHILADGYWAKNRTWRTLGKYGYYVFFKSGAIYYQNRTYPKYIRCVRSIDE